MEIFKLSTTGPEKIKNSHLKNRIHVTLMILVLFPHVNVCNSHVEIKCFSA